MLRRSKKKWLIIEINVLIDAASGMIQVLELGIRDSKIDKEIDKDQLK